MTVTTVILLVMALVVIYMGVKALLGSRRG